MDNYQKFFTNIATELETALTSIGFYWQVGSIILSFAAAILFYKIAKRFYLTNPEKNKDKKFSIIYHYFFALLLPIFTVVCLSIGAVIFDSFFHNVFLFQATIQLLLLFSFLKFLRILFNSRFIANLFGFFLIPALILNIIDLLDPTIEFLDSFAISIGAVRISIYTAIQAFVILSLVFWASGFISKKTKSYFAGKSDIKISTKTIISKVIDISMYFVIFIIILKVFGVDMTTFAVVGGAVGVGIGFGLQKIASNFISGVILLLEKSVEVGDIVEIDNGSIYGTLTHFGGRYTLIETFDGREIMVPNEDFITGKVTNWTYNSNRGRI